MNVILMLHLYETEIRIQILRYLSGVITIKATLLSSTSINVEHYLLSFRLTEMHYKWPYLELCITFFIPSLSLRVLEFTSNTCRLKAEQINLLTFLALWPIQRRFFSGSFVLITHAPHLFYSLVTNSITVLCILLS